MRIRLTIKACIVILLAYLSFWFTGCEKETRFFPSPKIEIDSVVATGLSDFVAYLKIDLGEGQEIRGAKVIFDDITILSAPDIEIEIPVTQERYQDTSVTLQIDQLNHDFSVRAVLETEKYQYFSDELVVRSVKNTFKVFMLMDEMYGNEDEKIADCFNKGGNFSVFVAYNNKYTPDNVEVKLNKNIPLEHTLDFHETWGSGDEIETIGRMTLPENIDPGVYSIDVYLEGHEFECEQKIKVLDGQWNVMDSSYTGEPRGGYASFLIGDEVFVVGGNYYIMALDYSPVWKFNLQNNQWTHLANFPLPGDPSHSAVYNFNLKYNNKGFVVIKNVDTVEVWEYIQTDDSWIKVTQYPGTGDGKSVGFVAGSSLFIGGGNFNNVHKYDFWSYDFITGKWNRLNDIPFHGGGGSIPSCNYENKVLAFAFNELWEYDTDNDKWINKSEFPGFERFAYNVAINGDKFYVIGGMYADNGTFGLMDCWEYSIKSDIWDIKAFLPDYYANGIAYTYDGKVNVGLGYVIHSYWEFDNNKLYQLDLE